MFKGIALVGEHLHFKLNMDDTMLEIGYMISAAVEVRDRAKKNTNPLPDNL